MRMKRCKFRLDDDDDYYYFLNAKKVKIPSKCLSDANPTLTVL